MTLRRLTWVQAHPITTFYLLAFTISWLGWIPTLATSSGFSFFTNPIWTAFLVLPALGPAIAAKLTMGWQGHASIPLNALFWWRMSPRWYVVAVGLPLLTIWMANGLIQWLPATVALAPIRGKALLVFVLLSLLVNPWEEVGWRGFALKRLQVHYSPFAASLLVGVLWGSWHLPLFFIHNGPVSMALIPFWPWFAGLLGWSFVMTWLFNHAAGSLLICAICHVAVNGFGALLGTDSYWALAVTRISLALILWLLYGAGSTTTPGNPNATATIQRRERGL